MGADRSPLAFPSAPEGFEPAPGMTLRDWFAGQALAGLLSVYLGRNGFHDGAGINTAIHAYRFADAMLAEREKQP